MKTINVLFAAIIVLGTTDALACINTIPASEAVKAIAKEPGAGAVTCGQRPGEECYCFDGVDWSTASLMDVEEDDTSKPLYGSKYSVTGPHATLEACQAAILPAAVYVDPDCPGRLEDGIDPVTGNTGCFMRSKPYCEDADIAAGYTTQPICNTIEGGYESYCISPTPLSYEKRTVTKLQADPVKVTAKAKLDKQKANKVARDTYMASRDAEAEATIKTALAGADDTTHLMIAMSYLDTVVNPDGTNTPEEIAAAKVALTEYRTLMSGIQAIRMARDADMAAWQPPNQDVAPLYPE